jgi:hypothetical protein
MIDSVKLISAYGTASLLAIGGMIVLIVAWLQPIDGSNPRDLAILFGVVSAVIGQCTGFLFNQEVAKSATRAAQLSSATGASTTAAATQAANDAASTQTSSGT